MNIIVKKPTENEKAEMQAHPIWECGVSKFDWHYDSEETCLIIEGEVEVTYAGGGVSFGVGDMVYSRRDYPVCGRLLSLLRSIMCFDKRYLH